MATDPEVLKLRQKLEAALPYPAEEMDLEFRAMFGGVGAYVRGRFFASLSNVGLALKFPTDVQEELLRQEPSTKHLQYEPGAPINKQYLVVPTPVLENPGRLEIWLKYSIDYVLTLPLKPRKKKSSTTE